MTYRNVKTNILIQAIAVLLILLYFALPAKADWTDNWTFNGIRLSEVADATWSERGVMVLGVAAVYGVHFASHVLYCEIEGLDWHIEGFAEVIDGEMTKKQKFWMGNAGFLGANVTGWGAKLFGCDGLFWRSYNVGCAFETITYPAFSGMNNGDDIEMIDDGGGDGKLAWGIYSVSSAALLVDF